MYIDMDMFESNVSCLVDRSYCGAAKQFHGRHISDAVFMIPPGTNKDDFFLSVPEHEEQLQYGRVLLFFKLALVSSTSMRNDVDLAFVEYLDKYTVNGNVLWKYLLQPAFLWKRCITLNINVYWYICCIFCFIEADQLTALGHIRLYEPSKTWFEVIPVSYIIGKLPMMPDFGNPTIPYRLRRYTMAFLFFWIFNLLWTNKLFNPVKNQRISSMVQPTQWWRFRGRRKKAKKQQGDKENWCNTEQR